MTITTVLLIINIVALLLLWYRVETKRTVSLTNDCKNYIDAMISATADHSTKRVLDEFMRSNPKNGESLSSSITNEMVDTLLYRSFHDSTPEGVKNMVLNNVRDTFYGHMKFHAERDFTEFSRQLIDEEMLTEIVRRIKNLQVIKGE